MSSLITAIALGLLLLAADPAPDAEPTAPADGASLPSTSGADKDRLVCRRESKPNTRFTSKVCKTAAEWEERAKAAQQAFEDVRGRPTVKICPPVGGCD
jgi:hypothetical protein